MLSSEAKGSLLRRRDDRIVVHFDYDAFYCSVFEAENPALKSQAMAVQQKQIIVTCNYEARRRGLRKLQLVTEAKQVCPDVIIVLGEDLTRFRDASKSLYNMLRGFSWNDRVERLGFDEVWMDVTDIVDYNLEVLNRNDLENSFFQLSKTDPTSGFVFDASRLAGHNYPPDAPTTLQPGNESILLRRLILGSHFALRVRHQLEEQKGYTSTVGVSTSRLLSKLVGNVHKPKDQTTLLPPYEADISGAVPSNVTNFLDAHEIGLIPYVGFKSARKLREFALGRPAEDEAGLVYGRPTVRVTVGDIRQIPGLGPEKLEDLLSAPGTAHGTGTKTFLSLHGIDNTDVAAARNVPRQISIEDSYLRLDAIDQVYKQLHLLSKKLIERMRMDLTEEEGDDDHATRDGALKWVAYPTTLRLSTRPRPPRNEDGTRSRSVNRISRSSPLPRFVFSLTSDTESLTQRLLGETIMPLFKKLHPEKSGWNLSLLNVAVTGMDEKQQGTDIDSLFRRQQDTGRESEQHDVLADVNDDSSDDEQWDEGSDDDRTSESTFLCPCGMTVPLFAMSAHERFHELDT